MDTPTGTPDTCRYAALANVRLPITDSGRMAVSGQSFMATGGQNPMSADTPPKWVNSNRRSRVGASITNVAVGAPFGSIAGAAYMTVVCVIARRE